jgi:hypothetical protein
MSNVVTRRLAGAVVALVAVLMLPLVASAETFSVSLPTRVVRGATGDRVDFGARQVPAGLVGQTCTVVATGNNNTSVHVGNDLVVDSASSVRLFGVEDSRNKTTVAAGTITLGNSVRFILVLGPDPVFSADLNVIFDCQAPATTTTSTTSSSTTSTTEASTTTTEPPTTTTEPPTTTVPESTTTTEPPTITTADTSTTTTEPEVEQETTSTTAASSESTLPFTGAGSDTLGMVAFLAVAAGGGLVMMTRRSAEAEAERD